MTERLLVLFPNAWDHRQFADPKYRGEIELTYHGSDLFSFPGNVRLVTFDAVGFVRSTVARAREVGATGVLSSDEYVGAIIAAAAAQELGLPGSQPAHIITAQHKYYSRVAQAKVVPDITPAHALIPISKSAADEVELPYPFFVKPAKGTFSLFAAKVDSPEALRKHLDFNLLQRLALNRIVKPYDDLLRAYTDLGHGGGWFVGESLMQGDQVTVDGFVWDGEVHVMGIVDSVMFPGTQTFERFEYPSRLEPSVQERMADLTRKVIAGLGYRFGQFNVELFYDRPSDRVSLIEINPRLSYQFADLYEYVDGSNTYDVLLDLSRGREPTFEKGRGEFKYSASFVMRTFEGKKLTRIPTPDEIAAFIARYGEATVKVYGKRGSSTKTEMSASGSYRYAIVNVAANSLLDLFAIYEDATEKLPFAVE